MAKGKFEKVGAGWIKEGENGKYISIVVNEDIPEDTSLLLFPRDDDYYEEQGWEINENTPDFSVMMSTGDTDRKKSTRKTTRKTGKKSGGKKARKTKKSIFG